MYMRWGMVVCWIVTKKTSDVVELCCVRVCIDYKRLQLPENPVLFQYTQGFVIPLNIGVSSRLQKGDYAFLTHKTELGILLCEGVH